MKTLYKFQGITLELDDANADTPAMVLGGKASSTFDCACATGRLVGERNEADYFLTVAQVEWLESNANEARIDAAYTKARAGNPQYQ